ncbi:MAG: hypothetical protein AAGA30_02610 [Planctomycetota bacterium]
MKFRFGLRAILISMTILCALFAVIRIHDRSSSIDWVRDVGGDVQFEGDESQFPTLLRQMFRREIFDPVFAISLKGDAVSDIERIQALKETKHLELSGIEISQLKPIQHLRQLESLLVLNCPIDDWSSLESLKQLSILHIKSKNLPETSELRGLPDLKTLALQSFGNRESVYSLAGLESMHVLEGLAIQIDEVSDLNVVLRLEILRHLFIETNRIDNETIKLLKLKLPSCKLVSRYPED